MNHFSNRSCPESHFRGVSFCAAVWVFWLQYLKQPLENHKLCLFASPVSSPYKTFVAPPLVNCFTKQDAVHAAYTAWPRLLFSLPFFSPFGPECVRDVPPRPTPVVYSRSQERQRPDGTRLHSERRPRPTRREKKTTLLNANTSERRGTLCLERDLMRDVNTNTTAKRVDGPHDKRTILLLRGRMAGQTLLSSPTV